MLSSYNRNFKKNFPWILANFHSLLKYLFFFHNRSGEVNDVIIGCEVGLSETEFQSEKCDNAVTRENLRYIALGQIMKSSKCHAKEFALYLVHSEKQSFLNKKM